MGEIQTLAPLAVSYLVHGSGDLGNSQTGVFRSDQMTDPFVLDLGGGLVNIYQL
jgi:hypothetical protein